VHTQVESSEVRAYGFTHRQANSGPRRPTRTRLSELLRSIKNNNQPEPIVMNQRWIARSLSQNQKGNVWSGIGA